MDTSDPNNPQNPTGVAGSTPPNQPDLTTPPATTLDPLGAANTFTPPNQTPPEPVPAPYSPTPTPDPIGGSQPALGSLNQAPTAAPDVTPSTDTWTNSQPSAAPPPAAPDYSTPTQTTPPSDIGGFNPFSSPSTPPPAPVQTPPEPSAPAFGGSTDANPFSAAPSTPPPPETNTTDFSAQNLYAPTSPGDLQPTPQGVDQAPTDLSHLIDPSATATTAVPEATIPQPETLLTPDGGETAPNLTSEHQGKSIPKWVLGVGIALLIAVVGASAYFILGIGQSPQPPTSLPATQQPGLQAPPTPTPAPATSSAQPANFGAVNPSPTASASATPKSAGDLLRSK